MLVSPKYVHIRHLLGSCVLQCLDNDLPRIVPFGKLLQAHGRLEVVIRCGDRLALLETVPSLDQSASYLQQQHSVFAFVGVRSYRIAIYVAQIGRNVIAMAASGETQTLNARTAVSCAEDLQSAG